MRKLIIFPKHTKYNYISSILIVKNLFNFALTNMYGCDIIFS